MSRRALALLAACGGAFLAFLDTTIVNTSFPDIRTGFPGASNAELSWVLDAYFILMAAFLVPAGGMADRLGRRRVFLTGVVAFVATSLLCAVAPTWEMLVVGRALQGISSAILVPSSLALMLPLFPIEKRAAGVGIWGAAAALSAAVGPPLGGLIVEVADWRWIFLVNLPLGALVLTAGIRGLDESRDPAATGLPDLAGATLAALSMGLLALGLVEGNNWGWTSSSTLAAFATSVILLAAVVTRSRTHARPVIDLELLKIPSFRQGTLGVLFFAAGFFAVILGNILFLTEVWGYSVLSAGLAVVPGPLAAAIVAAPAGVLADRWGHRMVIIPGAAAFVGGLLLLRSTGIEPDYVNTWLPGQILVGIGIGLAFPTLGAAAAADIPPERFGIASAMSGVGRQLGAVVGTAVLIAIVGEPGSIVVAAERADDAFLFGIAAGVASGLAVLRLKPGQRSSVDAPAEPARFPPDDDPAVQLVA